jgi:hypothetical protein|tara:strand:- start:86 stop:388 length:303 start_codon:yes stop_codon:yes gene_type:complete
MRNKQYRAQLRQTQSTDLSFPKLYEKQDYHKAILKLYEDRSWYIFIYGEQWFVRQVERLIQDWTESGQIQLDDFDNDYTVQRICWETSDMLSHISGLQVY